MTNITILDASGVGFFARQLEHIKAKSYDVLYQDLIARQLFPVSNEAGEAVDTITYRTYDMVGAMKVISNYAGDLPRADVSAKETTVKVKAFGGSFGYNRDEILKAQLTGTSLEQRRANALQRAWEQSVDDVAWNGNAEHGLIGFLNHPNIPTKASLTLGWEDSTADEIIQDVNDAMGSVRTNTLMKEQPDTLMIPVLLYNYLTGTPRASNSDTTIYTFLLQNIEGLREIVAANELSTTAYLYTKDPDKLQLEIPKELEFLPPQEKGLELIVPGWGKVAGVNIYYPLSVLEITDVVTP